MEDKQYQEQPDSWNQLSHDRQDDYMKSLSEWNNTATVYPENKPFFKLIEEMAAQLPSKTALSFGTLAESYHDLNGRANQMARLLIEHGVLPGDKVAVMMNRSPDLLASFLAVVKAGAAYIPIDPEYPGKLIGHMLNDSSARLLITTSAYRENTNSYSVETIIIDEQSEILKTYSISNPELQVTGTDLAYVIYTSGSTGKPKGIAIEHRSLTNFLLSMQKQPGIVAEDKLLAITTVSFDISGLELYLPLITGSELILADAETSRDAKKLLEIIKSKGVSIMQATPSGWRMMLEMGWDEHVDLKALCGGEALPVDLAAALLKRCCEVWNMYGPTETTIWSAVKNITHTDSVITIGRPIDNTQIYILDEALNPVPVNGIGDLYIAGDGLAREYLNQPDLTAKSFIKNPFSNNGSRLYRTGDLARFKPNGEVECLGRIDNQIKVRGHRIEPGATENILQSQSNVRNVVVAAVKSNTEEQRLTAYIVTNVNFNPGETSVRSLITEEVAAWKNQIGSLLPEYMVPEDFIGLGDLPLLPNGKINRNALPKPESGRQNLSTLYKTPVTATEKLVAALWAEILGIRQVGILDNFFDLGGNSLLAVRFVSLLENKHDIILPVTRLYQYPFIEKIASSIDGKVKPKTFSRIKKATAGGDIAIIGMAGRFPGASSIEDYWEILSTGKETTSFFTAEELDPGIPTYLRDDPNYVRARGILENVDQFDAAFFGINKRQAEIMDPQQRIFLEIAWEALEGAGYVTNVTDQKIGIFAGSGSNSYYINNIHSRPEITRDAGYFQVSTLNDKDYLAMRVAYELNLKGPAVSVYSSSSTSLMAIAQAVESLRQGMCDAALAGAITINSPVKSGHIFEEGAMFSKDGHCRPFDADATGTVFSDGAGIVLLKRLEDAKSDGDPILAVIKGIGINNDGALKASFTAPHAEGQADAIQMAITDAGIDASSISYIEAHGTATPIGDPIEIEALNMVFSETGKTQFCAIGSAKSNMGHLTHAAGVAGVIKTVLAMQHRQIPPSLFFEKPNPSIDFEKSPFFVNTKLSNWNANETPRRAGVSSFGMGGTNVHIVLEESVQEQEQSPALHKDQLIVLSAKNIASLNDYNQKLVQFLNKNTETSLADIAFNFQQNRTHFNFRRYLVASSHTDLIDQLSTDTEVPYVQIHSQTVPEVVFLFPGQGSQYLNMGAEIYQTEPVFREAVDSCSNILMEWLGEDLRDILFHQDPNEQAEQKLNNTRFTQPALFVIEYAMARLWMSWGIKPAAMTGHSIGEFVAAHLSGIFSLEDVLKVVSERARLISSAQRGSMLAVKLPYQELEKLIPASISIAAINSPDLCVVSGRSDDIDFFAKTISELKVAARLIKTSHAFHSAMMDEITEPFGEVVRSITLHPPRIPMVSTVTGKWMSEAEATDPEYWTHQLRLPVRFADAISTLLEEESRLFIESGPGNATAVFARQQARGKATGVVPGFENKGVNSEYKGVLDALGKIWQNGVIPDWSKVHGQSYGKTPLPTYSFNRTRYWIEPRISDNQALPATDSNDTTHSQNGQPDTTNDQRSKREILIDRIKSILENTSGIDMKAVHPSMNFIEIGLDSLLLTQIAITLKKEFAVPVTFRQLNEALNTLDKLTDFIKSNLSDELFSGDEIARNQASSDLSKQINELNAKLKQVQTFPSPSGKFNLSPEEEQEVKKPFGASPKIEKVASGLTTTQADFLNAFTSRYTKKTRASKDYTQNNRDQMADPRVVSGFRPTTKELVYPIVAKKSKGSRIWDIDNNEYIDALNGFGSNMLGYQPDVLVKAIKEQIDKGYEIGPQHELAADVCRLVCEFTSFDRAAICSTGSEAVMGTMRIARTVTGRSLIVAFSGSYHGIFDEVIIRGTKTFRSIPAAAGIMPESVQNMLILDYGTDESLNIIKERAHELAAVLVEPVQSRRPDFQPVEFLKKVREITEVSGTALIFDEVITGFRMHPGGAQALFDIKADIASYGKVIGGGLPVGVIAGKKSFMDALDGGSWQFGDDSTPDIGVTYFAGTFVRHPLALASAQASLAYFKLKGPALQNELNQKGAKLMSWLNKACDELRLPLEVVGFGSLWRFKFKKEIPYSELLFTLMRDKGIHILDGFPCFITESHTLTELESIAEAFRASAKELIDAGFLLPDINKSTNFVNLEIPSSAPVPGARLGRDQNGNPAWFIPDPDNPGKYLQVNRGS